VLAELGDSDLAIEVALSNNVSPAFAIATKLDQLKHWDIRDGEDEEEEAMRQTRINDTVQRYLGRVKVAHLCEVAQYLIALRIDLSAELRRRLIDCKQVAYVVGCFLSPEVSDIARAVDFICGDGSFGDEQNKALTVLINTDLN